MKHLLKLRTLSLSTYLFMFALISMTIASVSYAQTDVYLCTDIKGKKEYRNTGSMKGCKLVDLPPMNGVTSPTNVKKPPVKASAAASTPANFPKVDSDTQKSRDSDRKQILIDELKAEELKLVNLKKEYNNGEPVRRADEFQAYKYVERVRTLKADIERSEKNIEALKREIGNLK
jgi:hypothetical protein